MFKFRRRPKSYISSNSYFSPRKPRRRISPLWIVLSIPVALLVLELLARLMITITGKGDEIGNYQGEPVQLTAYGLKFVTENQKSIGGLSNPGQLIAQRSPSTSYQLQGNQKHTFWQINEQGFRDEVSVPVAKPKNEIRIFILGSSTAFGQGSPNNAATISHQLETRLNARVSQQKQSPQKYRPDVFPFFKPDREKLFALPPKIKEGKYRVINAAVPGYASGNQLAQLALQILPYQPDLIIIVNGYTDLILSSNQTQTDIPKIDTFLENAPAHFRTYLGQSFSGWLDNSYLYKSLEYFFFKPQPDLTQTSLVLSENGQYLAQSLPKDAAELQLRLARYQGNHQKIMQLCNKFQIPVVFATQPEITGRLSKQLTKKEQDILDALGKDYAEQIAQDYPKFIQANQKLAKSFPNNVKALDLYTFSQKLPNPAFADAIHLTEEANKAISEQLYQSITNWQKMQIIPQNFYLKDN